MFFVQQQSLVSVTKNIQSILIQVPSYKNKIIFCDFFYNYLIILSVSDPLPSRTTVQSPKEFDHAKRAVKMKLRQTTPPTHNVAFSE